MLSLRTLSVTCLAALLRFTIPFGGFTATDLWIASPQTTNFALGARVAAVTSVNTKLLLAKLDEARAANASCARKLDMLEVSSVNQRMRGMVCVSILTISMLMLSMLGIFSRCSESYDLAVRKRFIHADTYTTLRASWLLWKKVHLNGQNHRLRERAVRIISKTMQRNICSARLCRWRVYAASKAEETACTPAMTTNLEHDGPTATSVDLHKSLVRSRVARAQASKVTSSANSFIAQYSSMIRELEVRAARAEAEAEMRGHEVAVLTEQLHQSILKHAVGSGRGPATHTTPAASAVGSIGAWMAALTPSTMLSNRPVPFPRGSTASLPNNLGQALTFFTNKRTSGNVASISAGGTNGMITGGGSGGGSVTAPVILAEVAPGSPQNTRLPPSDSPRMVCPRAVSLVSYRC